MCLSWLISRFSQWGVSNFAPEMLEQTLRLCEEMGLQKPSCYQGEYNIVTRGMETRLLPILRAHGMTYNAYRCVMSPSLASWLARFTNVLANVELRAEYI